MNLLNSGHVGWLKFQPVFLILVVLASRSNADDPPEPPQQLFPPNPVQLHQSEPIVLPDDRIMTFTIPEALSKPKRENTDQIDGVDIGFDPIGSLQLGIRAKADNGNARLPSDYASSEYKDHDTVSYTQAAYSLSFNVPYRLPAAEVCYGPTMFEQPNLERHGHYTPVVTPVLSAAHFFANVTTLPYRAVSQHPHGCYYHPDPYAAGYHAPRTFNPPPLSPAAGVIEAGVITGLFFVIP